MKFISEEDPMQSIFKWHYEQRMDTEVESKICVEKLE
jgi:hypothetical protein